MTDIKMTPECGNCALYDDGWCEFHQEPADFDQEASECGTYIPEPIKE